MMITSGLVIFTAPYKLSYYYYYKILL